MAKTETSKDVLPSDGFGNVDMEALNFQQLLELGVIDISEIDDVIIVNQAELVGVPFILYDYDVKQSQTFGGEYAVCRVKTAQGTRVFTDGGTGICEQLERYKNRKLDMGARGVSVYFHHGLRASSYIKTLDDGTKIPATTYYFDNRPRD